MFIYTKKLRLDQHTESKGVREISLMNYFILMSLHFRDDGLKTANIFNVLTIPSSTQGSDITVDVMTIDIRRQLLTKWSPGTAFYNRNAPLH